MPGWDVSNEPLFRAVHAGPFRDLAARFGPSGAGGSGELFLGELLGLSGLELALLNLPPGGELIVDHDGARGEELVVCVSGRGPLVMGDDSVDLQPGVAFVPPRGGVRRWHNSGDHDLSLVRLITGSAGGPV